MNPPKPAPNPEGTAILADGKTTIKKRSSIQSSSLREHRFPARFFL
ncbi:MAG: hypothetical protein IPN71_06555 [Fibrobacteres bacterium]|jgi:hypothetical protein|nr:hypothetical protein [Fibrobacterota bacterium]